MAKLEPAREAVFRSMLDEMGLDAWDIICDQMGHHWEFNSDDDTYGDCTLCEVSPHDYFERKGVEHTLLDISDLDWQNKPITIHIDYLAGCPCHLCDTMRARERNVKARTAEREKRQAQVNKINAFKRTLTPEQLEAFSGLTNDPRLKA